MVRRLPARATIQYNFLTQLVRSLTAHSKPVVRQSAKLFLESYLGESIPYSAVKPTGNLARAITKIRKMVT